jgi:hypothetical protein
MSGKGPFIARLIGYNFIVSTFFQLISRSPDERWNAIPAIILAITFILIAKREQLRTAN